MPLAKVLAPLVASAPTVGVTGPAQLTAGYPVLELTLRVLELTAGTARARVETSDDGEYWDELELPAGALERTTPGKATVTVEGAGRQVRLRLEADGGEVAGAVQARALQVYASLADLHRTGLNEEALDKIPVEKRLKQLIADSDTALGFLRRAAQLADSTVKLPLVSWGGDLSTAVAKISAYHLRGAKGEQPAKDVENTQLTRWKQAMAWLEQVAKGEVLIDDGDDTNDDDNDVGPEVFSDPPWGF